MRNKLLIEAVGTFFLCLAALVSSNALPVAALLCALIYMGAPVSLAHYNPAVSLAFRLRGRSSSRALWSYVGVQLTAAVLAAHVAGYLLGHDGDHAKAAVHAFGESAFTGFGVTAVIELLCTFALAFIILVGVALVSLTGAAGRYGNGDVQWMTAGAGILHKEFHEEEFSKKGGLLHGAQLWVNLPAKDKSTPPTYQDIRSATIPEIQLADDKGKIRIIAGEMNGTKGPANTFTRINIFDAHAKADASFDLNVVDGDHTTLLVLKGTILINNDKTAREGEMLVFENSGENIHIQTNNETHLLLLSGEPITEPVAAYGPFVMNTQQEIMEAIDDFNAGKFGHLN